MAKTERKIDEATLIFAVKIVVSLALVFIVAIGMDIYHAAQAIAKIYARSI